MSEIYDFEPISPVDSDELITIRNRIARRSTVAALAIKMAGTAIHFGPTPPTDPKKVLWMQISSNDELLGQWQKTVSGLWVSHQTYGIQAFEFEIKRNWSWPLPNPVPGSAIWIERLTARAWVQDSMGSNEYIDFQLNLIDSSVQQTPFFYIRLAGAAPGDIFSRSEAVNQQVAEGAAVAFFLNINRTGQTKLKTASIAATFRRIYAVSS